MSDDTQIITRQEKKELVPRWIKILIAIPPVVLDGGIVMSIAFLTAVSAGMPQIIALFSNDDTYKYISAQTIFWLLTALQVTAVFVGAVATALVALQSFRNKVYAEHVKKPETPAPATPPTP